MRSVGVYCRCALHLSASYASIHNGTKRVSECHFDRERSRDLFNIEMYVDSRHLGNPDEWSLVWNPSRFDLPIRAPRSRSLSELWQVTRNSYCISFYFLHSDIKVKCEVFALCRIHKIFIIHETFSFNIYIYTYTSLFVLPSVRRQTVAILENFRSFSARRYIRYFYAWVISVIVEPSID